LYYPLIPGLCSYSSLLSLGIIFGPLLSLHLLALAVLLEAMLVPREQAEEMEAVTENG